MTEFDLAAAALVLVCAYGGYRRGLITCVLHVAGGLLAFGLAAVTAPLLAPYAARAAGVPAVVARPVVIILLTGALRVVFGFAVRELVATVRTLLRAAPPLALLDRLLGVLLGTALGAVAVLALTLAALTLPAGTRLHDTVAASWLARTIVTRPDEVQAALRRLWDGLLLTPPSLRFIPLACGVSGLWLATLVALRLRPTRVAVDRGQAPALRSPRARITAGADTADPLSLPRALLGVATAGAMMAALLLFSRLRG